MNSEAFVYGLLSADEDTTDLVPAARIYPAAATQDSDLPCVVYQRLNTDSMKYLSGGQFSKVQIRIDFFGFSQPLLMSIREAIKAALHGKKDENNGIAGCLQVDNSVETMAEGLHDSLTFLVCEDNT